MIGPPRNNLLFLPGPQAYVNHLSAHALPPVPSYFRLFPRAIPPAHYTQHLELAQDLFHKLEIDQSQLRDERHKSVSQKELMDFKCRLSRTRAAHSLFLEGVGAARRTAATKAAPLSRTAQAARLTGLRPDSPDQIWIKQYERLEQFIEARVALADFALRQAERLHSTPNDLYFHPAPRAFFLHKPHILTGAFLLAGATLVSGLCYGLHVYANPPG